MRTHVRKHLEESSRQVAVEQTQHQIESRVISMWVHNFVDDVDSQDEDELQEVCNDLLSLIEGAGGLVRVRVMAGTSASAAPYVEVLFNSESGAKRAAEAITGVICGGRPILAETTADVHTIESPPERQLHESGATPGRVSFFGWASIDEVADAEDAQEVLNDAHEICSSFGRITRVWLERRSCTACAHVPRMDPSGSEESIACAMVQCSTVQCAVIIAQALDGKTVGGSTISAALYDRYWYERGVYEGCGEIALSNDIHRWCVRFVAFAGLDEVADTDERSELTSNLSRLLESLGVHILPQSLYFVSSASSEGSVDVLLVQPDLLEASALQNRLSALIVGGEPLQVDVIYLPGDVPQNTDSNEESGITAYPSGWRQVCDVAGTAVVSVRGFFSAEDLEPGAAEDLVQTKRDMLSLVPGTDATRDVMRVHVAREDRSGSGRELDSREVEAGALVAVVEFASAAHALDAALHLDARVVGGSPLLVVLNEPLRYSFSAELLMARDYPTGSTDSAAAGGTPTHTRMTRSANDICLYSMDVVEEGNETNPVTDPTGAAVEEQNPAAIPASGESKYAAARALPRLDAHLQPNLPIPVRANIAWCLVTCFGITVARRFEKVADETTNAAAKELLRLISTFQARIKEKNPHKAKQKLRFVAGLKQVSQ
jgi:hypothetical protein